MITSADLLKGLDFTSLPDEHQNNLVKLLGKINAIEEAYQHKLTVTSGYRSLEDHLRIYKNKAAKAGLPFDESKVPMKSAHLAGAAVDIYDPTRDLWNWCVQNESLLEELGLWMEKGEYTPNWCHFQCLPPKSGNRFFIP